MLKTQSRMDRRRSIIDGSTRETKRQSIIDIRRSRIDGNTRETV
jgi:hypothetical protein